MRTSYLCSSQRKHWGTCPLCRWAGHSSTQCWYAEWSGWCHPVERTGRHLSSQQSHTEPRPTPHWTETPTEGAEEEREQLLIKVKNVNKWVGEHQCNMNNFSMYLKPVSLLFFVVWLNILGLLWNQHQPWKRLLLLHKYRLPELVWPLLGVCLEKQPCLREKMADRSLKI